MKLGTGQKRIAEALILSTLGSIDISGTAYALTCCPGRFLSNEIRICMASVGPSYIITHYIPSCPLLCHHNCAHRLDDGTLSCHRERSYLIVEFPPDAHGRVAYRSRHSTDFTADKGLVRRSVSQSSIAPCRANVASPPAVQGPSVTHRRISIGSHKSSELLVRSSSLPHSRRRSVGKPQPSIILDRLMVQAPRPAGIIWRVALATSRAEPVRDDERVGVEGRARRGGPPPGRLRRGAGQRGRRERAPRDDRVGVREGYPRADGVGVAVAGQGGHVP